MKKQMTNIAEIFNFLCSCPDVTSTYKVVGDCEEARNAWAYHSESHIASVINIAEKTLSNLGFENELIQKAKIACLLHDLGYTGGKPGHAERGCETAKHIFEKYAIAFDGMDDVLEAIYVHSDSTFDGDNIIAQALILADKLDIRKDRITEFGKGIPGNRQFVHVEDIDIYGADNCFFVRFVTDGELDLKEVEEYYFTRKIFRAIQHFSSHLKMDYKVFLDGKVWTLKQD